MKMCKRFPVTLEQYKQKHIAMIEGYSDDEVGLKARYYKAKFAYSCLKFNDDVKYYSNIIGENCKPIAAFDIWWDI